MYTDSDYSDSPQDVLPCHFKANFRHPLAVGQMWTEVRIKMVLVAAKAADVDVKMEAWISHDLP